MALPRLVAAVVVVATHVVVDTVVVATAVVATVVVVIATVVAAVFSFVFGCKTVTNATTLLPATSHTPNPFLSIASTATECEAAGSEEMEGGAGEGTADCSPSVNRSSAIAIAVC